MLERYLLGLLDPQDADRLDQASIEDDDVAARLQIVEQDLVDGYVRRTVPPDTLWRFESSYLSSPRRRRRVRAAQAFLAAVDRAAPVEAHVAVDEDARWSVWNGTNLRWTLPVAAAAVVVIAGALAFAPVSGGRAGLRATAVVASNRPTLLGAPQADAVAESADAQNARAATATLFGAPGRESRRIDTRSAPPPAALVLPPQTRAAGELATIAASLAARPGALELQMDSDDFPQYQVALKDPAMNRVLWRSSWARAKPIADTPTIAIVIPRGMLNTQRYWLELSGRRAGSGAEIIASYVFQISPP